MISTYGSVTKPHECFSLVFWIKTLYPIVFFSSLIYVAVLVLTLCGAYDLSKDHPVIIVGYISLIHLFSYPMFLIGINGNTVCLLIFPYINLVWIVAILIGHFVIHTFLKDSVLKLDQTPLHYHFLVAYFTSSVLLEILMMIFKTQEMKKISVPLETQESEERIINQQQVSNQEVQKSPENQYHTITVLNENTPDNTYIKDTYREAFKPLPKYVIEKSTGKSANKEQTVTHLIESQNSIRNILNKKNLDSSRRSERA